MLMTARHTSGTNRKCGRRVVEGAAAKKYNIFYLIIFYFIFRLFKIEKLTLAMSIRDVSGSGAGRCAGSCTRGDVGGGVAVSQ